MAPASQPPRLVIDTNILVPAVVGAAADPPAPTASASLLRAWHAGFCSVVVSAVLLDEYEDVLQRPPFGVPDAAAARYCRAIGRRAVRVAPLRSKALLTRDPDDDLVFRTALAGRADLLVTHNLRDFAEVAALPGGTPDLRYRGLRVVGLGDALAAIRAHDPRAETAMRRPRRWP